MPDEQRPAPDDALHDKVDRLLHDAEHADSGALMAGMMRDFEAQRNFYAARDNLLAEARELDPRRTAPAWQECRCSPPTPQPDA